MSQRKFGLLNILKGLSTSLLAMLLLWGNINQAETTLHGGALYKQSRSQIHIKRSKAAKTKQPPSQASLIQAALAKNPKSAQVHLDAGKFYEQQGNQATAEAQYQQAIALKPDSIEARTVLANLYEKRGDFRSAVEQLKSLVDSGKATWPLVDRVGKLSVRSGQPDVAVYYYRNWLNTHPDDIKASNGVSYAKKELARQKSRSDDLISQGEALRYAEQALQYNPENYEARLIAAKLNQQIGDSKPKMALGMVDVALNQVDFRSSQAYERGELLLSRYQFGQAEQAFREAQLSDVSPRGQMVLGELLLTQGLPSLAEEAFQRVLNMLPGNASARLGLAKAKEAKAKSEELILSAKRSDRESAESQAKAALKLNVKNADAYYLLAQLNEKTHDYSEAADYYYAYRELYPASNQSSISRKIESLKQKISR